MTMREIESIKITEVVRDMCIEANHYLTEDMKKALNDATESEKSPLGRQVLCQLEENLKIAGEDMIPICQDTGMAVIFAEVGQDVHIDGSLTDASAVLEGELTRSIKEKYAE